MKTYKSANEIKKALLSCETVKLGHVVAFVNDNDEVEIHCGDEGRAASLAHLDRVVADLWKAAEGMPDKTPKPVSYDSVTPAEKVLGPDSTSDSAWADPSVNAQPVSDGKSSDPGLGKDTTSDSPWTDPQVDKSPEEESGGMSDPDLGKDTTKNPTSWENAAKSAEESTYDGTMSEADPDHEFYPDMDEDAHQIENIGEEPASLSEFHSAGIVDTFANGPARGPSYTDLVNASPARELLADIGDHDRWATNEALRGMGVVDEAFDLSEGNELFENRDAFADKVKDALSLVGDDERPGLLKNLKNYTAQAAGGAGAVGMGDGVALPSGGSVTHPKKNKDDDKESGCHGDDKESAIGDRAKERAPFGEHGNGHGPGKATTPMWDRDKSSQVDAAQALNAYMLDLVQADDVNGAMDLLDRGGDLEGLYSLAAKYGANQILDKLDQMITYEVSAGSRIRENWGTDGQYSRDLDAESSEDLYHLVRSLGQDDAYDWAGFRPRQPGEEDMSEMANGEIMANKEAVDEAAKSYWREYFKGYGEELVKDDPGKKDKKDPKRQENTEGWSPKVDETPGHDDKGSDVKQAQMTNTPDAMPSGGEVGGDASPAGQPMGAPAPIAPGNPAAPPQGAPNAGNDGLKSLGWDDQDIQSMEEDQKQKILQHKIKKPGAPAPKAPAPGGAPGAPGAGPAGPSAPGEEAPMPDPGPAPMPAKPMASVVKAFNMLAQVPEAVPPAAPEAAPVDPMAGGAVPSEEAVAQEFGGNPQDSPEANALQIFNQIMEQEVKASSAEQVPAIKAQILVQRLLNEVGMTINDARGLFGLTKDKGFNTLFK